MNRLAEFPLIAEPLNIAYDAMRFFATAVARAQQQSKPKIQINTQLYEHPETQQAYMALHELRNLHGQFYSNNVVGEYLKVLSDAFPKKFYYALDGLTYVPDGQKSPLEIAVEIDKEIRDRLEVTDIAIPYDNRKHHIVIYIDRLAKRVEYYDPFGFSCAHTRSKRGQPFFMRDQIEAIRQLFFSKSEGVIVENRTAHQGCFFRCAIWGLYYIDCRLRGRSAEEISAQKLGSSQIDAFKTDEMVKKIEQRALLILQRDTVESQKAMPSGQPPQSIGSPTLLRNIARVLSLSVLAVSAACTFVAYLALELVGAALRLMTQQARALAKAFD